MIAAALMNLRQGECLEFRASLGKTSKQTNKSEMSGSKNCGKRNSSNRTSSLGQHFSVLSGGKQWGRGMLHGRGV